MTATPTEAYGDLKSEYERIRSRMGGFLNALSEQIERILSKNSVSLGFPIERRVKEWLSLAAKIKRQNREVSSVLDIGDLGGLRIILLFRRDVNKVDELLSKSLEVLRAEDTSERLTELEFGYQSRHYAVRLPSEWLRTPSLGDFGGLQAEIQVRTLAQHIWAAASHVLQYKSESSVPLAMRRTIHRAAALLETVDLEFERVLEEKQSYLKEIDRKSHSPSAFLAQAVDSDTLRAYSEWKYPGLAISQVWHDRLLQDLDRGVYKTLRGIDEARWRAFPAVETYRKEAPELFSCSTDFLTKSLGFVDAGFREKHPFARRTLEAFQRHKGLVRGLGYDKGQERQD